MTAEGVGPDGLDREAARARCEKATPGEWHARGNSVRTPDDYCIALTYMEPKGQRDRDAEFLAAARLDLPAALRALDSAGEVITRLEAENQRLTRMVDATMAVTLPSPDRKRAAHWLSGYRRAIEDISSAIARAAVPSSTGENQP